MEVTPKIVREFLDYDADTGVMIWRERAASWFSEECHAKTWNTRFAGKVAFNRSRAFPWVSGQILGKRMRVHQIAWAHFYGKWPSHTIDHINGDPHDNRISNLRDVPHTVNMKNTKRPVTNTSGVVGVYPARRDGRWEARIGHAGKCIYLGSFDSFAEAVAARVAMESELGFHPNHGRASQ